MKPWNAQRAISPIALAIYLVGGWIFPAAHHHHAHRATTAALELAAPAPCEHCAAHHSIAEPTAGDDESHPQINGIQVDPCSDLCSLCVARTMTKDRLHRQISSDTTLVVPFSGDAGTTDPVTQWSPHISPRGPPPAV